MMAFLGLSEVVSASVSIAESGTDCRRLDHGLVVKQYEGKAPKMETESEGHSIGR
jgi:hypothetical protein